MAYEATYEAGDLVSIVFDLIGGVIAELAENKSAIGGLILLALVAAMFKGVISRYKSVEKTVMR